MRVLNHYKPNLPHKTKTAIVFGDIWNDPKIGLKFHPAWLLNLQSESKYDVFNGKAVHCFHTKCVHSYKTILISFKIDMFLEHIILILENNQNM